jgi:hypothetical protein
VRQHFIFLWSLTSVQQNFDPEGRRRKELREGQKKKKKKTTLRGPNFRHENSNISKQEGGKNARSLQKKKKKEENVAFLKAASPKQFAENPLKGRMS